MTKAEMLVAARRHLRSASVPPLVHFSVADWNARPRAILRRIAEAIDGPVAVRSSARDEDGWRISRAGHYATLLRVPNDPDALADAITRVAVPLAANPAHRVLVQAMATNVVASGVVTTCDPATGTPYYVVEFDMSERTDTVTSGVVVPSTAVVFRGAPSSLVRDRMVRSVLVLARDAERWRRNGALDIEFAVTATGRVALLQVRPLPRSRSAAPPTVAVVAGTLARCARIVRTCGRRQLGIAGATTILAQMSDWNPAELLGVHPTPLAASVFGALVSDDVWQRARATMGYRRVPGVPLVRVVAGRPYVDVRASFNSFLPASTSSRAAGALVDAWIARLAARPELHDRVELEVAETAIDFAFRQRHATSYGNVLRSADFADWSDALRALTNRAVSLGPTSSLSRARALATRMGQVTAPPDATLVHALRLLAACRRTGTLPFAIVARHAFIAEALLRSAVIRGAWSAARLDAFRSAQPSVHRRVACDLARVASGHLDVRAFLRRFGHLRPSSFDVTSLRYDQRPELFVFGTGRNAVAPTRSRFIATRAELHALDLLAREAALACDGRAVLRHAAMAIVARDEVKFALSRLLSDALEGVVSWGAMHGLPRGDVAFLTLRELDACARRRRTRDADVRALADVVATRRAVFAEEAPVRLAPLLRDVRDLYVPPTLPASPTFVTRRTVTAPVALLAGSDRSTKVARRIVCIESADPGFDWIFAHPIAGLVTGFGGGNSHMAIRCIEADVPAVLGVGETAFAALSGAHVVELRCAERTARPL